ncbi:MAG: hypothetical protein HKN94_01670 [Acidimicrobiales bacterium]|nr:hypothetical protein [Acidimicrobiales bacterium]RZV46340.1 MAG: hypothetical protein EX269_07535 [Acidimicrobiales bacterium]
MLIDQFLPERDFTAAVHTLVEADPRATFEAISEANLGDDTFVRLMSGVRDLPNRISAMARGEHFERMPDHITFGDLSNSEEWVTLGEVVGEESVVGAIGKFWKKDYGWATPPAEDFVDFNRPGYAKTVAGFSVHRYGEGSTLLTMESRTAVTDDEARCRFNTYWRFMRPFAAAMMRHGIRAIKRHAEGETPTASG